MLIALIAALLGAAVETAVPEPPIAPLEAPAQGQKPARKKTSKPPMTGVLNVNRASEAELRLLPGIGKRRAQLIIERREKKPFASVEEVGRIKGLRSLVHRLHAHLTVQGDTTLRPLRP